MKHQTTSFSAAANPINIRRINALACRRAGHVQEVRLFTVTLPLHERAGVSVAASTAAASDQHTVEGRRNDRHPLMLVGWLLLLGAALAITAITLDSDVRIGARAFARETVNDAANLRWPFAAVVVALGALHYLASAVATRAASGLRLPMREATLVQFACASANRLTPAGLGGSALSARYLVRRGLDLPAAIGVIGALTILGAFADFFLLFMLVILGPWLGLHGGAHEVLTLVGHVRSLLGPVRSPWLWIVVATVVAAAVACCMLRAGSASKLIDRVSAPVRTLTRRPGRMIVLLATSGATTLILGIAFAAATAMVPGPHPPTSLGAMLVAFMIASAVGSAVPVPAGLGSTEAALVGVLVSFDHPPGVAVQVVMLFRLITFWAPAALGVLALQTLRRRAAI